MNETVKNPKNKSNLPQVLVYTFLSVLTILYLLPLLWVIYVSLKDDKTLFVSPWAMPEKLMWENYTFAWTAGNLYKATINSAIVCAVALLMCLLIGSMAAFAIGRLRWKFSGLAMTYFLIGMMVPVHCILIPLFTKFSRLHLTNNIWGLVIPYLTLQLPITIFIMTGFFEGMPNELFESACIDGCSIYGIFGKIALPLSRTGLFVTGLMTFVANWNELLLAMVFISDDNQKTLPVSLSKFVGPYNTNYSQMFAAIVIAIIPSIVVYVMFANSIVDGLTQGAVKG